MTPVAKAYSITSSPTSQSFVYTPENKDFAIHLDYDLSAGYWNIQSIAYPSGTSAWLDITVLDGIGNDITPHPTDWINHSTLRLRSRLNTLSTPRLATVTLAGTLTVDGDVYDTAVIDCTQAGGAASYRFEVIDVPIWLAENTSYSHTLTVLAFRFTPRFGTTGSAAEIYVDVLKNGLSVGNTIVTSKESVESSGAITVGAATSGDTFVIRLSKAAIPDVNVSPTPAAQEIAIVLHDPVAWAYYASLNDTSMTFTYNSTTAQTSTVTVSSDLIAAEGGITLRSKPSWVNITVSGDTVAVGQIVATASIFSVLPEINTGVARNGNIDFGDSNYTYCSIAVDQQVVQFPPLVDVQRDYEDPQSWDMNYATGTIAISSNQLTFGFTPQNISSTESVSVTVKITNTVTDTEVYSGVGSMQNDIAYLSTVTISENAATGAFYKVVIRIL
jgi:hypothetical protein